MWEFMRVERVAYYEGGVDYRLIKISWIICERANN